MTENVVSRQSSKRKLNTVVHGDVSEIKKPVKCLKPVVNVSAARLTKHFYDQPCLKLAEDLLGKVIVRSCGGHVMKCKIVEVEGYLAEGDRASHSFNWKKTKRNEAMFMEAGSLYVYMTYGMYHCMNISAGGNGDAVLIRAAQPVSGIEIMRGNRSKSVNDINICNGPSKLCQSLSVTRSLDKENLTSSEEIWLERANDEPCRKRIVRCKRIGLNEKRCGEWALKPLRFYLHGNPFVSRRDKEAESHYAGEVTT